MTEIKVATEIITESLILEVEQLFHENNLTKTYNFWQFSPPFNQKVKAVTARANNKLIGFNATMPILLNSPLRNNQKAIWSCDFIVDRAFRQKGVGHLIKSHLKKDFAIPTMALGISDSAISVLKKEGWSELNGLNVYRKTIKPDSFKSLLHYSLGSIKKTVALIQSTKNNLGSIQHKQQLPSGHEIDNLWNSVSHEYGNCVVRNADYIQWRYSRELSANYRFITSYNQNNILNGLLVYRNDDSHIKIIDYIASLEKPNTLAQLLSPLEHIADITTITFNNSNLVLARYLPQLGYIKSKYQSRFACNLIQPPQVGNDWFLSAGDSDGEIIQAVKSKAIARNNDQLTPFQFSTISETDFDHFENEWQSLLYKTSADKLFMDWYWMNTWWHTWKETIQAKHEARIAIILIKQKESLVGIIPLYYVKKKLLAASYTEYHFLGNAWRILPSVRSEYISPIFHHKYRVQLMSEFSQWMKKRPFNTTLIWPDCHMKEVEQHFSAFRHNVDFGVKINTYDNTFNHYKSLLGRNTKLKGISRQNSLKEQYPNHQWQEFTHTDKNIEIFFNYLNTFHIKRWQKECFDTNAQKFHQQLILSNAPLKFELLYLKIDNNIESVLFNIIAHDTVYNIQSGYSLDFHKKYSLGTMHLLHSIEESFNINSLHYFDLLAGSGLNTAYKNRYKGETITFITHRLFSRNYIAFAYNSIAKLKKYIHKQWNK